MMMVGIDHSLANLDVRAQFALNSAQQRLLYDKLLSVPDINGAVILSTCNRTELYLSVKSGVSINPVELLCNLVDADCDTYENHFKQRCGDAVFRHLCHLACGAKSQIWGEDQIITQVKDAAVLARECRAADHHLEVLFRTAITAAKKIKTTVRFSNAERSVASKTLALMKRYNLNGELDKPVQSILVIGNGIIGRLVANELLEHGYSVTVTRRHHGGKTSEFPETIQLVDYHDRYSYLNEYDAVISATSSPHHTLALEPFAELNRHPALLIDLAVPRDIDRRIAALPGITLEDIDTIAQTDIIEDHARQLLEIDAVIEKYNLELQRWKQFRMMVQV